MSSVNISIKKEAYEYLKSLRRKDESFSDIILEFKEKKRGTAKDLLKYFGAMKDMDINWKEKEEKMNEFRRSFERRLARDRRTIK